jgi:hypothetical protein
MRRLSDNFHHTINGSIVGSIIGFVLAVLIPTNFLPSDRVVFPVVIIFAGTGAIIGIVLGIVIRTIVGALRYWRS